MWLFLKLFLQTPSFEPQHKVLLKSDQMIYCNDKPSSLKLLFLHLWEWETLNVTFTYSRVTPANPLYSHNSCRAKEFPFYWKKEPENSVLKKVWLCTQSEIIWLTYDDFCQKCSVFHCSLVSNALDAFTPKNFNIFMGKKSKNLLLPLDTISSH